MPTCSEYSKQAFMQHGFFRGIILSFLRIFRCTGGLFNGGEDPVPDAYSFSEAVGKYKYFYKKKKKKTNSSKDKTL